MTSGTNTDKKTRQDFVRYFDAAVFVREITISELKIKNPYNLVSNFALFYSALHTGIFKFSS